MKTYKQYLIPVLVAAIIGLGAGIGGFFISRYYLSHLVFGDVYLPNSDQVGQKEVVIKEAKNVVVEQDVKVKQLYDQSSKAIFGVYHKKPVSKNLIDQIYTKEEFISQAVAVTSDGWFATIMPYDVTEKGVVLVKENKAYEVKKIVSDPQSRLKFIQVESLSVPVLEFSLRDSLSNGQTVVLPNVKDNSSALNHLEDISSRPINSRADLIETVENYDQRILLSQDLGDDFIGSPVLSLNTEIVGLYQGGRRAIKINYINSLLKSLLKDSKISRPYVGINFISLYNASGSASFGEGVEVVRNQTGIAVRPDSPFAKSLLEGDIILSVEDQKITSENSFADIIYDYRPGNSLKFKVKRQDKELEIEKVLGSK